MADITDASEIPDGVELTEAQIRAIINRIDRNIYNLLAGKYDLVDYAEFGSAGHRKEPSKMLAELRELKVMYQQQLNDLPFEGVSLFDDPGI